MSADKFLSKVEAEPALQTRVEETQLPDGETRSTTIVLAADGRVLGGVDEHFSEQTAKSLTRSIEKATGIDLG